MEKKLPYLGKKLPCKCDRLPRFKSRPLYLVGVGVRVRVRSRKKVTLCGKDHMGMVVFIPFVTQKEVLKVWKKVTLFRKKATVYCYRLSL